jgi:hypothetical protein
MSLRNLFLTVAVTAVSVVAAAQAGGQPEGVIDTAVRDLELAQHEKLVHTQSAHGASLSAFTTDGCSGGLSSVWQTTTGAISAIARRHGAHPPWEACCVAQDRLYHAAAPLGADAKASYDARLKADEDLRQCVRRTGSDRLAALSAEYGLGQSEVRTIYDGIASFMYRAVRLGGAPCTKLSWRWGYGWPNCE